MMHRKRLWIGALLLLIALMGSTLLEAQVPPADPCDPPPSCDCKAYESCGHRELTPYTCIATCTFSWSRTLALSESALGGVPDNVLESNIRSLPDVNSLKEFQLSRLIDLFTTTQLSELSPDKLAEHLHEISDLVIFKGGLNGKLNEALRIRFPDLKEGFTFTIDSEIKEGVSLSVGNYLINNGKTLYLPSFKDFDGITAYMVEDDEGNQHFGFTLILAEVSVDITGDIGTVKAERDVVILRNDMRVEFKDDRGSVHISGDDVTFSGAYITIQDDELYGAGRFSLAYEESGFGAVTVIDRVVPIIFEGEESWGCVDTKDRCARSSEGADRIAFCLECPDSYLDTLQGHVENGKFDGFVFWTEELNHLGELTPAATARGLVIANFGQNGPLVEGNDLDMEFQFHTLGTTIADDKERQLNDLEFVFHGEEPEEGILGSIHNGNNVLTLEAEYEGSRFDGIHVVGSADRTEHVASATFRNFNPKGQYDAMEWESLVLDFSNAETFISEAEWELMIANGETLLVPTADDRVIEIGAEDYRWLYGQWMAMVGDLRFDELETTLIHHDSFRYDPNTDENIKVENLYYSDGWDVTLSQRAIDRSGIFDSYLNLKFQEQAWQDIEEVCSACPLQEPALRDERCGSCSSHAMQQGLVIDRLEFLRSELFMEQQRHEIHGLLEYLENPEHAGIVDDIFQAPIRRLFFGCGNIVDHQKATQCLYEKLQHQEDTLETLETINLLQKEGLSLSEIQAMYQYQPKFWDAFMIPSMEYTVNIERLRDAVADGEDFIIINGREIDISTPELQYLTALALKAQAAEAFSEQGFYGQALEYNKQLLDIKGVSSDDMSVLLQSLAEVHSPSYAYRYGSTELEVVGLKAGEEVVTIGGAEYVVSSSLAGAIAAGLYDETILKRMLDDGIAARQEESAIKTKEFITEIVPDTPFELALNLIPELYVLGKTGIITRTAAGLINWGKTTANAALLALRLPAMGYIGIGGGWTFADEAGELVLRYGDEVWDVTRRGDMLATALELDLGRTIDNINQHVVRTLPMGHSDILLTDEMLKIIDPGSAVLRYPDGSVFVLSPEMVDEWKNVLGVQASWAGEVSNRPVYFAKNIDGEDITLVMGVNQPDIVLKWDTNLQGKIIEKSFEDNDVLRVWRSAESDASLEMYFRNSGYSLETALTEESYNQVLVAATAAGRGDDPVGWLSDYLKAPASGKPTMSWCHPEKCMWFGPTDYSREIVGHPHPIYGDAVVAFPSAADLKHQATWVRAYEELGLEWPGYSLIFHDAGITVMKRMDDGTVINYMIELADTSDMNLVMEAVVAAEAAAVP